MDYAEALAFWYGRINYEIRAAQPGDLKLERMRALLRALGDPHDRLRLVHVTGTKGKGSTAAMLAVVLRAAGYRVGLFTSPHLSQVEERIRVDGEPITSLELAARIAEIAPAVRAMEGGSLPAPTFFEIGTALGFLHFCYRRCDVAIIEVGLGGRFDSTNVCRPLVSVITSIGLDHTAQLGPTLEAIAYEKAGIVKRGVPVVSGVTDPGSRAVIRNVATAFPAPLTEIGTDFRFEYQPHGVSTSAILGGLISVETNRERYPPLRVNLLGRHQGHNAAVALATLERLRDAGFTIPLATVASGLAEVSWPARVEVVSRSPVIVLDTSHNVPSVEALVATLRESFPVANRKAVVFAVSSDKQYPEMLRVLAGYFDRFYLTRYGNNPRCVPPEKLAALLGVISPQATVSIHAASDDAWKAARSAAGEKDLLCITGSVFLSGELRPTLTAGVQ